MSQWMKKPGAKNLVRLSLSAGVFLRQCEPAHKALFDSANTQISLQRDKSCCLVRAYLQDMTDQVYPPAQGTYANMYCTVFHKLLENETV